MSVPILRVRGASWRAGTVPVLEGVTVDVAAGEFVAVMGRNGAGKSTLLDLVAGLKAPSEGAILLDGRPLNDWSSRERAQMVAHLPQSLRGDLSIRAEALVLMGRYPHAGGWMESSEDTAIAVEAMSRCDCLAFRRRPLGTLSGGERQRVFLAACLAQRPRLLLLDEPATYLDVDQQLHCFSVLRAEADRGAACVAVTHDVNLALAFCTRIIVLAERVVAKDIETERALDAPEWLRVFSSRLTVGAPDDARPWVRYQ